MMIGRERPKRASRGEKIRWLAGNTRLVGVKAVRSGHEPHVGSRKGGSLACCGKKDEKTHVAFGCTCMVMWQIVSRIKWLKRVPTDDRALIAQLPSVKISRDQIYPTC